MMHGQKNIKKANKLPPIQIVYFMYSMRPR